jgi:hypothetical protein
VFSFFFSILGCNVERNPTQSNAIVKFRLSYNYVQVNVTQRHIYGNVACIIVDNCVAGARIEVVITFPEEIFCSYDITLGRNESVNIIHTVLKFHSNWSYDLIPLASKDRGGTGGRFGYWLLICCTVLGLSFEWKLINVSSWFPPLVDRLVLDPFNEDKLSESMDTSNTFVT